MRCQVLLCVQRNFLLRLRFGMADDRPSSVCLSLLNLLVACCSTASASARFILSSAAASRADEDESPFNRLSILLRHAPKAGDVFTKTRLLPVEVFRCLGVWVFRCLGVIDIFEGPKGDEGGAPEMAKISGGVKNSRLWASSSARKVLQNS